MVNYSESTLRLLHCCSVRNAASDIGIADKVVTVPEMAESISEGTLKQWSKRSSSRFCHIERGLYAKQLHRNWGLCGAR